MNRLRRLFHILGVAALALAAPAAWALPAPVELVSPRPGATLLAGSEADLEWAPLEPFVQLAGIEEWEAFLSFDGGETYPVRITPHLDRDLRRVRWQVPGVPTDHARILLRLGDERRETYLELPQRFSIAAAPGMERTFTLATVAPAAGEPALPGHPGVAAWVEGSRRGGSLRQRVAPERPSWRGSFSLPGGHAATAVLVSEGARADPLAPAPRGTGVALASGDAVRLAGRQQGPLFSIDILLLTQRQNE
ncbi:MAG TPA: hypothetical protein VHC97_03545 [Thermoanaerobaculia bacterium]|jgi:hypothetical protein|nr:hypothetical protein [Thermoanaerobaculia bacterium]